MINRTPSIFSIHSVAGSKKRPSTKAAQTTDTAYQNVQLCYLTIAQAVPVVINLIMFAIIISRDSSVLIGSAAFEEGLNFEDALNHLSKSYVSSYLIFCCDLSNNLAHCFHFYLYLIFSRRFRQGFLKRFQICL